MVHKAIKEALENSNVFNCESINEFTSTIRYKLNVKGHASGATFYICDYKGYSFLTKLVFYDKLYMEFYSETTSVHSVDAEIRILEILNDKLVRKNITPCILELIYYKICNGIKKLIPKRSTCDSLILRRANSTVDEIIARIFCEMRNQINVGIAHDKCAFLVLERCDMTLEQYLEKSLNTTVSVAVFKTLLFQIIYTFYTINALYPKFSHNDLHPANIMLWFDPHYKFKLTNPKYLIFHVENETYSVPYFGIMPKIIDFGYSSIPEEGINNIVMESKYISYAYVKNDLTVLFHHIYFSLTQGENNKLHRVSKILSSIDPSEMYMHMDYEYIRRHENVIPTYKQMIKSKAFNEYKNFKAPISQIYNEFIQVD